MHDLGRCVEIATGIDSCSYQALCQALCVCVCVHNGSCQALCQALCRCVDVSVGFGGWVGVGGEGTGRRG